MFVNAGGGALKEERNLGIQFQQDCFFQGGDVLRTDETIIEGGDIPSLYQSARVGNFCYIFNNLSPGDYFVDLQFAEIINTNGPRGMRVFDVFMQEEKASKPIYIKKKNEYVEFVHFLSIGCFCLEFSTHSERFFLVIIVGSI